MIKIQPIEIEIKLSVEQADLLRFYLSKSVLKSDDGYSNPCAVEAIAGNELAVRAMRVREILLGCLDSALVKVVEDADGRNYPVRKTL
ncbi:MAG TPA: hypothetical protein DDW17_09875 [Deltaproteobacteria bacterium]|nr:hypothetical protein [Deltaproteobacteria bacterium]